MSSLTTVQTALPAHIRNVLLSINDSYTDDTRHWISYLNDNDLTHVPPEMGQMTNLEKLDLSNNRLSSLPGEIGQLVHLEELRLEGNPLTDIPPEVEALAETGTEIIR